MQTQNSSFVSPLRLIPPLWAVFLLAVTLLCSVTRAADAGGTLSGSVSNTGTGNLLEGARVEIASLGLSTLTDSTGRYVLSGVPAGTHEVTSTYTGLDPMASTVTITAGQRATRDFNLTAGVYRLSEFRVTGEREGNAAAITSQRNADNVKNVVALDSYGNLPNMSAGELAIRLPGVAGNLDDEGNVTGVTIRGAAPGLNRVNVDGNLMSNVGGMGRNFQMHSLTGAMFEQLELVKGHTPDQSADSLGGSVNLKTRSPLSIRERRRIGYSVGARWAAPFFEQGPLREQHRIHPQVNVAYQEVFDVFGGNRNLGIALNTFYSENVNAPATYQYDYQNTENSPAYLWDYRTANYYNSRKQSSVNLKAEYRLSEVTKLTFNGIYNDADEAFDRRLNTRAFTGGSGTTPNATTSGVVPGFTETLTTVRPVAASIFETTSTLNSFFNRTRLVNMGAEHKLDRWAIDYDGSYSQTHNNLGTGKNGGGGSLVQRVLGVGWTIDTSDPENPVFTQTGGPSIYDPASYNNSRQLVRRNNARDIEILNAKGSISYRAETSFPLNLKTGAFYRKHEVAEVNGQRRWDYIGATPLPNNSGETNYDEDRTGRDIPFTETASLVPELSDTTRWREDIYYRETQKYLATRNATEEIAAGYLMAQGKIAGIGFLGGARVERTEVSGFGYYRGVVATAAQIPDPAARAEHDWNNPRTNSGKYTDIFPSAHVSYDITPDLKTRASWSTSFGRPAFTDLLPSATISDPLSTVTINNPALKPQYSKNVDLTIEYYFKPAGLVSLGFFTKDISDYIVTGIVDTIGSGTDNGFNGDYAGYTLLAKRNSGTAKVQGWEFDYRQQFTFLPGFLGGLGAAANFTWLKTHGDYGGGTTLSTDLVDGFIPESGNVRLTYNYRGFGASASLNYTGRYLQDYADQAPRLRYRASRAVVNVGVSYQLRPQLTLFADIANLTNEPQRFYRFRASQVERYVFNNTAITFGV
ncbi:MAG: TonB-dependent receptor, partial [Verrucomicrobiota bacterium]